MKVLPSDDDSGYISPASDEMESLCSSRKSSHICSLVSSERKFEITFEVNDLIVVSSSTVDVMSSNQSKTNDSTTSTSKTTKYLDVENDQGKPNTGPGHDCQHRTHKSATDSKSHDFACYDTVELELVVQDLRHKSPDLSPSDDITTQNDEFSNNTTSSENVVEEYHSELPIPNSLDRFEIYKNNISDQSGYISPASSEGDGREKLIRFRGALQQQDNDSTGYVSSISDDLSEEDDDTSSNVEQVIEAQYGNDYLLHMNMDPNSKTEKRDDMLLRRSSLKSQNPFSQKSNFIINK